MHLLPFNEGKDFLLSIPPPPLKKPPKKLGGFFLLNGGRLHGEGEILNWEASLG